MTVNFFVVLFLLLDKGTVQCVLEAGGVIYGVLLKGQYRRVLTVNLVSVEKG